MRKQIKDLSRRELLKILGLEFRGHHHGGRVAAKDSSPG